MSKSRTKRKRRRRGRSPAKKKAGVMMGMRSGFKGIGDAVIGAEDSKASSGKNKWIGPLITILLVAAAVGILASKL